MRKREHFIGLWLDDREYSRLLKQCSVGYDRLPDSKTERGHNPRFIAGGSGAE